MTSEDIKIGTQYIRDSENVSTVVDVLTTYNSKGEVVRRRYVAERNFCGQTLTDRDVLPITILRGVERLKEWRNELAGQRHRSDWPVGKKITCRWVNSRACYQIYVSGKYISGACGDSFEDACDAFEFEHRDAPLSWRNYVTETHK
jgi:hypothetical protein